MTRLSDPGRFGQPTYEARRLHVLETLPVDLRDYVLPEDRTDDHTPASDLGVADRPPWKAPRRQAPPMGDAPSSIPGGTTGACRHTTSGSPTSPPGTCDHPEAA